MNKKYFDVYTLTQLALLVAIEFVMKAIGLGSVPVGPLYMSFLTVPIAIGAIMLGPVAGGILGGVFGMVSFWDAVTAKSVMTGALFQVSPFHTFVLCVVTRVLMGVLTGIIYRVLSKADKKGLVSTLVGTLSAPVLNTIFFMGYICLAFWHTDYVQGLASSLGAVNPLMFVILLVGVQGLIEAVTCGVVGTVICKALHAAFGFRHAAVKV